MGVVQSFCVFVPNLKGGDTILLCFDVRALDWLASSLERRTQSSEERNAEVAAMNQCRITLQFESGVPNIHRVDDVTN